MVDTCKGQHYSSCQINIQKNCEGRRCCGSFRHVLWVAAARKTRVGLTLIITRDVGGYCPSCSLFCGPNWSADLKIHAHVQVRADQRFINEVQSACLASWFGGHTVNVCKVKISRYNTEKSGRLLFGGKGANCRVWHFIIDLTLLGEESQ